MPSQLCVLLGPEKKKKEFILCETEELFTRPKAEHVPSLSKASYGPLHCKREVGVTDQNIMWPIKMQFILCIWISAIHTISERIWNQKNIWIYMWYCWYNIFRISKEVWTYGPIGPILSQTFFNGYRYLFAVIKMVFYSNTTWVVTCFNMSHSHVYILTFSHGRAIEGIP